MHSVITHQGCICCPRSLGQKLGLKCFFGQGKVCAVYSVHRPKCMFHPSLLSFPLLFQDTVNDEQKQPFQILKNVFSDNPLTLRFLPSPLKSRKPFSTAFGHGRGRGRGAHGLTAGRAMECCQLRHRRRRRGAAFPRAPIGSGCRGR